MKGLALTLLFAALAGLLALAPAAGARVIELGANADPARAACPRDPCEVLARATAYPGRAGRAHNPFVAPSDGLVIAFTVVLGKPNNRQINYFSRTAGFGSPQVQLSILRKGRTRKSRLDHRLRAQSPAFPVQRYLGSSPTFVLPDPLPVRRGYIVALTSRTWVPAFARGLPSSSWWRASRPKGRCQPPSDPHRLREYAMQTLGAVSVFGCAYSGQRPLYTATFVPNNKTTDQSGGK